MSRVKYRVGQRALLCSIQQDELQVAVQRTFQNLDEIRRLTYIEVEIVSVPSAEPADEDSPHPKYFARRVDVNHKHGITGRQCPFVGDDKDVWYMVDGTYYDALVMLEHLACVYHSFSTDPSAELMGRDLLTNKRMIYSAAISAIVDQVRQRVGAVGIKERRTEDGEPMPGVYQAAYAETVDPKWI